MQTSAGPDAHDRAFFGHPKGLSTLFFTEMWERFSYYGMRAILLLFMVTSTAEGGLGFDDSTAAAVYGLYTSMVYMTALPGGWIADRLIGQRRAVLYGGILIASGHFSMAVPSIATFYLGLFLIVLGTGLLKPNVSVIVGQLYSQKDNRRDAGYSIFYMGINLGAFIAPLVCGYLGEEVNWHMGFGAAGIGMLCGLIQYTMGAKYLGTAGLEPAPAASPQAFQELKQQSMLIAGITGAVLIGLGFGMYLGVVPITAKQIADGAGYFLLFVTVVFFGWLFFGGNWTRAERKRLYVIGVLFLAAALFWSVFEQAGLTLTLFAERATRTSLLGFDFPTSWFQSLNSLFIIAFAPVFGWLWLRMASREPSSPAKFSMGLLLVGAGFLILVPAATSSEAGQLVSPMWLTTTYLLHTFGELCLSPVGLSAMTKLAPARIVSLMMGVWFLATSVGNYIGGRVASVYESFALPTLFMAVAAFAIGAGVILLLFVRPMRSLIEAEK